jgi:hypothetical protein
MSDAAMSSAEEALPGSAVPTDAYTSLKQNYDGLVQFLTLVGNCFRLLSSQLVHDSLDASAKASTFLPPMHLRPCTSQPCVASCKGCCMVPTARVCMLLTLMHAPQGQSP